MELNTNGESQQETLTVRDQRDWMVVSIHDRVDAFNFPEVKKALEKIAEDKSKKLAIDLADARFLSFSSIKFISNLADQLNEQGRAFALVAPSEKLKRQIDIYASLEQMMVFRSDAEIL